jgi:hypothetical protein
VGMQKIVRKYPRSEVVPLAQNLIDYLSDDKKDQYSQAITTEDIQIFGNYRFHPDTNHLYILIIKSDRVNLDAVKLRLSDFNQKQTLSNPLTITNMIVDNNSHWVSVLGFRNMKKSQDYISEMETDEYVLSIFNSEEYQHFVISIDNYQALLSDKNISEYLRFYYKYYQTTN